MIKTCSLLLSHLVLFSTTIAVSPCLARENNDLVANSGSLTKQSSHHSPLRIVFFGDSLTAGYGLSPKESYPSIISSKLSELAIAATVENAGVSGDTTANGLGRLDWVLGEEKVDIFVLALGANDGLRGLSTKHTKANLEKLVEKVQEHSPRVKIILAGMKVPPNMGRKYAHDFEQIFIDVSKQRSTSASKIVLVPFLLEGVAARRGLNLPDGIHPNAKGQKILAENVWRALKPLL